MNAERLYAISLAVQKEINQKDLVTVMQATVDSLRNIVQQPNQEHQQAFANNLSSLYKSLADSPSDNFSPSWKQVLDELDGSALLGKQLQSSVQSIVERNQITTSVCLEELEDIQNLLKNFKNTIDNIVSSFSYLKIGKEELNPGECELGIVVPRAAISNNFGEFVDELSKLNFVFRTFSEVTSSESEPFTIKTLSSSDLMMYVNSIPLVTFCIAYCVEKILMNYKQLLEIRKLKMELEDRGVPQKSTEDIKEYANTLIQGVIQKLAEEIIRDYCKVSDDHRKEELRNALNISLNRIANRIDKGYNIEVRAESPPEQKEGEEQEPTIVEDQKYIMKIQEAAKSIQFMKLEGREILHLPEKIGENSEKKD